MGVYFGGAIQYGGTRIGGAGRYYAGKRLLTINKDGQLIIAKEPLHFYEPNLTGLDCGYSFGTTLLKNIPDSISVFLIPTAVGGSSISQWLGDSVHRNVKLFSNFLGKLRSVNNTELLKAFYGTRVKVMQMKRIFLFINKD